MKPDNEVYDKKRLAELALLAGEYNKNPALFTRPTFYEDADSLRPFGIYIPNKKNLPHGYLKFLPQDFIVEEIQNDNTPCTVTNENTLDDGASINENDPTIYATLVKCGISTIDFVEIACRQSGLDRSQIQYAGLKDKDAITAQRISFRNTNIETIKKINSPHFFLKDVVSGKGIVDKGGLKGNRFTIFIRTTEDFNETQKQKAFIDQLQKVQSEGFYNFYYLQRFGTPRLMNFVWGLHIINGNYKEAVESYLTEEHGREVQFFKNLRATAKNHLNNITGVKKIFEQFSGIFFNELKIATYLEKNPGDYKGALADVQEQSMLWVYGLSSLLFNEKISSYLERGKKPPASLPLFLSNIKSEVDEYKQLLESAGIYPPPFHNLKPFPFIRLQSRMTPTNKKPVISKAEIIDQGVILQFTLEKGEYATTLLSHIFNLISDTPPLDIKKDSVDTKEVFGEPALKRTLEYFSKIIYAKDVNPIEILQKEL